MKMQTDNNVILFPKWKKMLEKESLQALKNKEFEKALEKLDKLLSYQVNSHEIITGKLICLMELNRYDEAQELCEQMIQKETDHYYQYIHIYLTILFQTNQYELLMEQAEQELENIHLPKSYRSQFKQLYDMSEKMKMDLTVEKSVTYLEDLFRVVEEEDHTRQWQLVENLRKMKITPTSEVADLLVKPEIHPVIKTAVFRWMKDVHISTEITIHKFNLEIDVIPEETTAIRKQEFIVEIDAIIRDVEQKNPTLFYIMKQILYRYAYVLYPFIPPRDDVKDIGEALIELGKKYINIHSNETLSGKVSHYIEEMKTCEALYMSVIDE